MRANLSVPMLEFFIISNPVIWKEAGFRVGDQLRALLKLKVSIGPPSIV